MSLHLHPFRYRVLDGYFDDDSINAAADSWPAPDWPHWLQYNQTTQKKRSCAVPAVMPDSIRILLRRLLAVPAGELLELGHLEPDHALHGAGLHSMYAGDKLGVHLDCDTHPMMPWRRRANAILFLSRWNPQHGGALRLLESQSSVNGMSIMPVANRLVLFECSDQSFHGVDVLAQSAPCRMSLACYFWSQADGTESRRRAQFI